MSGSTAADDFNERRFEARVFYLAVNSSNADGTMDLQCEMPSAFGTLEEATEHASDEAREHGGSVVIFRCLPVRRVEPVPVIITDLNL